uniref:DOD-type homing endonuclease domain-containing protein n=1 Tax=viral metagenome TaxID=1070528 RepID=A0A6C0JIL8_9ZZZZ
MSDESKEEVDLENLIKNQGIVSYNPDCVRKKSNWSKASNLYKLDKDEFSPKTLLKDIPTHSPKLQKLLDKIDELDRKDHKKYGKLFKHFIFSDLKSGTYGAKLLAGALVAKGMKLGYVAKRNKSVKMGNDGEDENDEDENDDDDDTDDGKSVGSVKSDDSSFKRGNSKEKQDGGAKKVKPFGKIELLTEEQLKRTKQNNFYLLSSVTVFDQPISVATKKDILANFNKRPDNVHGDLARIIVMDSGFKEGIDLFDIKYIHIFEPSVVSADQKQVIGRGTRTCGQKGLEFHPTRGWPLYVFIYDLSIPEKLQPTFLDTKSVFDLYLKTMNLDVRLFHFAHDLEKTTILGSVDYDLNKNIHTFSIPSEDGEEGDDGEYVYGGGPKKIYVPKMRIRNLDQPLMIPPAKRLGHEQMRQYIQENFGEYAWDPVKMENLCAPKQEGGSGEVIKYTPTQSFISHYFTPTCPVKGMLLSHSVGTGKCHAKDTPILMYNGSIKKVQDIEVGEFLMGDNSTPRKVLSLATGTDEMFDIIPTKGEKYTVNSEHILCLKYSGRGTITNVSARQPNFPFLASHLDNNRIKIKAKGFKTKEEAEEYLNSFKEEDKIVEIEVKDYLKLPKSLAKELKGYRKGVEFSSFKIEFDPYIIGLWLGDGSCRGPVISNQDARILHYLRDKVREYGLQLVYQSQYDYRISSDCTTKSNAMINALEKYNLINNKHIPRAYKCNDRSVRLSLLAGLIDSDGYYCQRGKTFSITQKNDKLAEDILFLARSLGFAAYLTRVEKSCIYKGEKKTGVYNSISISGQGLHEIPTKVLRKQAEMREQIKDPLTTGVTAKSIGEGTYYGFTLDGNNRYLLGDFTVTHNTCSAIAAATTSFEKQGYTILWVTRTTLKNDIWKNMFDQVCNESIREKIQNHGLHMPKEQDKRMKLLSKSWKIRPMSYKQFSNLVSKQNSYYKDLVKINGETDPLRKTLLIIDEAHKLYGGGDLSSIERPDMKALHQSLMASYEISGGESVKLLLMTATPITQNPMELIQLINLCKPQNEQMPTDFDEFSQEFLNEQGQFTDRGRDRYLDDISGYVSYLNREKDARQFSQPQIEAISSPLIEDMTNVEKFDKRLVRELTKGETTDLKNKITEKQKELKGELGELDANTFNFLKEEVCGDLDGKPLKQCSKVVKSNIKQLMAEARDEVKKIRSDIKELRERIKERSSVQKDAMTNVRENIIEHADEYEKYKESLLYSLKQKCAVKVSGKTALMTYVEEHPSMQGYNRTLQTLNDKIEELHDNLKVDIVKHKSRIDKLKKILKTDLSELERSVINMTLKEEKVVQKSIMKLKKKETAKAEKDIKKSIGDTKKLKKKQIMKIRKTIKATIKDNKKKENQTLKEQKKLRKTMRKEGTMKEEIKHDLLKELVDKYKGKITEDLVNIGVAEEESEMEKEHRKQDKLREQERKKEEKLRIAIEKRKQRDMERDHKNDEKNKHRQTKKLEKEQKRREKQREKEDKKQQKMEQNKTKKSKK